MQHRDACEDRDEGQPWDTGRARDPDVGQRRGQDHQARLAVAAQALAAAETRARGTGPTTPSSRGPRPHAADPQGASRESAGPEGVGREGASPEGAGPERGGRKGAGREEPGGGANAAEGARAIVLRQLSMGPRSRQQLADKLRQRGCPDDVATTVLDRMSEVGLVDDESFAEMLVRSKQAGRGLATRALAHELRTKGVGDEIVARTLGSIDLDSERARAEELAAKKLRTMGGLDVQVQARRLSGMLVRKGYPPSLVYAVVRDTVNAAPEHQRD